MQILCLLPFSGAEVVGGGEGTLAAPGRAGESQSLQARVVCQGLQRAGAAGSPWGWVLVGGRANSISTWGREKKKKRNDTGNGFIISEQSARAQPQGVFTSHDSKSRWASPGSQHGKETPVAWVPVPSLEPRSSAGAPPT